MAAFATGWRRRVERGVSGSRLSQHFEGFVAGKARVGFMTCARISACTFSYASLAGDHGRFVVMSLPRANDRERLSRLL
jgi:hypothetical protein